MAAIDRQLVGRAHTGRVESRGIRLVGGGRIVEAVADHGTARGERRRDHLMHQLGTGGLIEEQLTGVAHLGVGRVEQDGADLLGDGDAARFAEREHVHARAGEGIGQERRLRGLAAAVDAFERYE